MRSMSTFLRTPFSEDGLKCTNFYEGILTNYIHNSNNHHHRLQQLQLNKKFICNKRHLLSLIRYLSYTYIHQDSTWVRESVVECFKFRLEISVLCEDLVRNVLWAGGGGGGGELFVCLYFR